MPHDPSAGQRNHEPARERAALHEPSVDRYQAEIVQIDIDEQFNLYDRAKILRAVNEWNHVLNGFVRLDIATKTDGRPMADQPLTWWVVLARADKPGSSALFGNALALTYPLRGIGGMVIVYVDRLGKRDLASVMRHELGHVLGLGHDPHGRLMSIRYTENNQECVDKAAAEAIAANRKLRVTDLNWCEASAGADKTKSDL